MALEKLESPHVLATVRRLESRISARFPERNLLQVATELGVLIEEIAGTGPRLRRRVTLSRLVSWILMAALIVLVVTLFVWAVVDSNGNQTFSQPGTLLPLLDSTINDVVFAGLAVFFLYSLPDRLVRADTLRLLHQLTKDPERLRASYRPTAASMPTVEVLPAEDMIHYFDYCSELLSLVGKAAALCAEESQDSVVLDTVSTVEDLTVELSQKIAQKITLVNELGSR